MAVGLLWEAFRQLILCVSLNLILAAGCLLFSRVQVRKLTMGDLFFGLGGKCFPLLLL